jgi:hypothetical protein
MGEFDLTFKARIPANLKDELIRLFYFNNNQTRYAKPILRAVEQYGSPEIVEHDNTISLALSGNNKGQALFALDCDSADASLIGALIYTRVGVDAIAIIHLVIQEDASSVFAQNGVNLTQVFVQHIEKIAARVKNINKLALPYSRKIIQIKK